MRPALLFLGTPEFASVSLKTLLMDGRFEVRAVITQPDRPAQRKLRLQSSAVAQCTPKSIPLWKPENIKDIPLEQVTAMECMCAVVVAYGQILPKNWMSLFPKGIVNLHASLLPYWRGASPIQHALMAGDSQTGITLQKLVWRLDEGPIISKKVLPLQGKETAYEVSRSLQELGATLLKETLYDYIKGSLLPKPQLGEASYAPKLKKEDGRVDWTHTADYIFNRYRGLYAWPGLYTFIGKTSDCASAKRKLRLKKIALEESGEHRVGSPGELVEIRPDRLVVACGGGSLAILKVQPESRSVLHVKDFLSGYALKKGDCFL